MSAFEWETRQCPDCGRDFEALTIWLDDVACGDCGRKRYAERICRANEGRPYVVESIGGACPTQAEGRTADDRPYYFRARHGDWTLEVGKPTDPTDYCGWDGWGECIASGDDPSNGWMEDGDVLAILDASFGSAS